MKLAQKIAINYLRAKFNILAVVSRKKAARKAFDLFCTPVRKSRKKTPPIFEKAEKLSFPIRHITIRGYRWNYQVAGKKILIVHGFESICYNFERYIAPLVRKGYEVMAFDGPAHGKSGGKTINLPLYVETLKEIVRLYGPIDGFIGHSFGGLAIAHLLESVPGNEKINAVLIAPATETSTAIDSFFRFLDLHESIRPAFDQIIYDRGGYWPSHYSIRRAMHQVNSQVLWFHDEDDEMTPLEDAKKVMEDNHPNIQFVVTKGLGHRKIYRDNRVLKAAVEFL